MKHSSKRSIGRRARAASGVLCGLGLLCGTAGAQCLQLQYAPTARSAGTAVADITAGDIDNDGDLDVLSADPNANLVRVLVNDGALGFSQRLISPGVSASVLALADVDSDGDLDLLTGFDGGMLWLLNDGAGHFGPGGMLGFPSGDTSPIALQLADVDEDGVADALVGLNSHQTPAGVSGGLWVALGDGAGGFLPLGTHELPLRAVNITLADFDGDRHIDVAELGGYMSASTVSIATGLGNGSFVNNGQTFSAGIYANGLASGDFDGDGDIDLATGFKYWLSIRTNDGAGNFTLAQNVGVGSYVKGIAAGDLDRDGDLDLLATSGQGSAIRLVSNDSTGHFSVTSSVPASIQCYSVLLADTSGDGFLDAWAGDVTTGELFTGTSQCQDGTTVYCTAKTNSIGCTPSIGWSGTPSASAGSGFLVRATGMISNKSCLLIYGVSGRASIPFQGGILCVGQPLKRGPVTNTLGNPPPDDCSGAPSIDMNLFAAGGLGGSPLAGLRAPGTRVNCQWWGRDPGFAPPNNTQLSDGLEYIVGP
jgi:FG-GAP-like repeat